jgi:hypothetical protein
VVRIYLSVALIYGLLALLLAVPLALAGAYAMASWLLETFNIIAAGDFRVRIVKHPRACQGVVFRCRRSRSGFRFRRFGFRCSLARFRFAFPPLPPRFRPLTPVRFRCLAHSEQVRALRRDDRDRDADQRVQNGRENLPVARLQPRGQGQHADHHKVERPIADG